MFEPVEKERSFERVVDQIEEAILTGQLRPGDHLPSERTLVDDFKVGRSTVREALRILESKGLLRTSSGSHRGPQISRANTFALAKMLNSVVRIEQMSLADLVQYRMITGSAANFLAAHSRTEEQLAALDRSLGQMRTAECADAQTFAGYDQDFHHIIRDAAGNALLGVINDVVNQAIIDLVAKAIDSAEDSAAVRKSFLALHESLFAAIRDQDGELASRLAKESLYAAYSHLLSSDDIRRLQLLVQEQVSPA